MKLKLPRDHFLSTGRVGDKGQIVIPKEVRDLFEIEPGDSLLLMADKKKGIAIVGFDGMVDFMDESIRQARQAQQEQKEGEAQ